MERKEYLDIIKKYKIRGPWTPDELIQHWNAFKQKYPNTKITFEHWLGYFGKVYFKKQNETKMHFSQKWVDRVTSEDDDGIYVVGKDLFEGQKIPPVQSGKPNLLSPDAYYSWYVTHSGLQEKGQIASKANKQERLNRVLKLYYEISKKIIEDLKPQYISEVEVLNNHIQQLESHLDNKLRVTPEGSKYININGKIKFDGSPEIYEEYFQSGKLKFREFVKEVVRELRNRIYGKQLEEEDKSLIEGPMTTVQPPKKPETIAVDLDNTLIDKEQNLIDGAKEALEKLKEKGYEIVIYTARFAFTPKEQWQSLQANIEGLLNRLQVPFNKVSIIKPVCKFYIDDRGVKFDNWSDVMKLIEPDLTEEGPQDLKPAAINSKAPSELKKSTAGVGTGNIGLREEDKIDLTPEVDDKSKSFEILK